MVWLTDSVGFLCLTIDLRVRKGCGMMYFHVFFPKWGSEAWESEQKSSGNPYHYWVGSISLRDPPPSKPWRVSMCLLTISLQFIEVIWYYYYSWVQTFQLGDLSHSNHGDKTQTSHEILVGLQGFPRGKKISLIITKGYISQKTQRTKRFVYYSVVMFVIFPPSCW